MPDSPTDSLGVATSTRCFSTRLPQLLWAVAVVWLVGVNAGCTSSLTAIALRDAMREIAEYGRRGEPAVEAADDEQLVEDADSENLMSLEEALDSAVTRLAAVGRLDAEARQMLLETLESTSQEDWPIVIESFASSLEEIAKGDQAIEQVAETLEAEAGTVGPAGDEPASEMVAAVDPEQVGDLADVTEADELLASVEAEPAAHAEQLAEAVDTPADNTESNEMVPVAAVALDEPRPVASVVADTVAEESLPQDLPPAEEPAAVAAAEPTASDATTAVPATMTQDIPPTADVADTETAMPAVAAAEATPEAQVAETSPGLLADRVTSAIRELPVSREAASEAASLSPEETMRRLEEALALARRQAPLRVENPCFAWQVRAWGDVERCDVSRFCAGQQVIVYFEVDNLTSDARPDGHATKLDTELRLVNVSGECLHEWSFPPLAESCPAPRRDYFARYILQVPEGIAPGPLRLEMTVNDLLGEKSADVALPLEVVGEQELQGERVASDATLLR